MSAAKSTSKPGVQRVAKNLHRRGNSYEFRKVIPPYARAAFGGLTAYWKSFGDVSLREAEHCAAECRRYCDRKIAEAANKPDPTARLASFKPGGHVPVRAEIDRAVRSWVLDREQSAAGGGLDRDAMRQRVRDLALIAEVTPAHLREDRRGSLLSVGWTAEHIAASHHWVLPPDGPLADYLHDRVGRAERELALRVKAELNYEDRPAPTHAMFDPAAFADDKQVVIAKRLPVPIMDMFEGYVAERQPGPKTIKKWRPALASLIAHLGHDDAACVTPDDIVAWKDALLRPVEGEAARGAATVRDGYLGGAKTVFGWGKDNRKIESNPVAGITVRVPRRIKNRSLQGFSPAEAKVVLRAALAIDCRADTSYGAFSRRWLPWLCAYTGARVTEMAQLRRQDVQRSEEGIWYVRVLPEAGSTKDRLARDVVLHPHLLEQGFIDAIASRSGPLFFDPTRKRAGSTGNTQAQKAGQRVADWVRSLGITDKELQPNHGWRHAFVTHARRRIDGDMRRAFVGHSGTDVHSRYGNVTLEDMFNVLKDYPRYNV
ncbi:MULTISPECIES: site-specific integrase [unclassified Sphingomonas]|uniref:hypothetical protein n=1 Tax=Sphingomonas sp. PvP015 TaxID=3156388 RepID=UPI0033950BE8